MLANRRLSKQSSKEKYKPWKWGATARNYASHTKTMLPTSPCRDPAGNRTTRRPPDHCKETQTAVVWSYLPLIRSGQNHLARHSERGRRQGRQRKRWEDNTREWTGLEFGKSQRAVENSEKWRKLVAKSSVVPQRPKCHKFCDKMSSQTKANVIWLTWWVICIKDEVTQMANQEDSLPILKECQTRMLNNFFVNFSPWKLSANNLWTLLEEKHHRGSGRC